MHQPKQHLLVNFARYDAHVLSRLLEHDRNRWKRYVLHRQSQTDRQSAECTPSGPARARVTGVKWTREGPLVKWSPPKNGKKSFFVHFIFEGPPWGLHGPSWARDGPLRPDIDSCGPSMDPLNHVNSLFTWNVDGEILQHLTAWTENGVQGTERRVKFYPFTPPGCATVCAKGCTCRFAPP